MTLQEEKKKLDKKIYLKSQQLAPLLDRFGRLLTDLAPHIAMIASSMYQPNGNNLSNLSMVTQEGSLFSSRIHDQTNRLFSGQNNLDSPHNPLIQPNNTNNNIPSHTGRTFGINSGVQSSGVNNQQLSSHGRSLNFEVPIILNPGELLSVTPSRNHQFLGEGNVHLHLTAQVHLPCKFSLQIFIYFFSQKYFLQSSSLT